MRYALIIWGCVVLVFFTGKAFGAISPTVQSRLNTTATLIAGKPVTVNCHYTKADWDAHVHWVGLDPAPGQYVNAYTYIGTGPVELSPEVCLSLQKGQNLSPTDIGQVVDTMAHEPNHAFGLRDERQTEACAKRYEALVIHVLYGVKYHTAKMRLYVAYALAFSKNYVAASYQGGTCPR